MRYLAVNPEADRFALVSQEFVRCALYSLTRGVADSTNSFSSELLAQLPACRHPPRPQRCKFVSIPVLRTRNSRLNFSPTFSSTTMVKLF